MNTNEQLQTIRDYIRYLEQNRTIASRKGWVEMARRYEARILAAQAKAKS